jgi:hypothetical protein
MTNNAQAVSSRTLCEGSQKKRKKQENITTMKRYIKPTSEFVEIKTMGTILIASIEKDETEKPGGDALSNEHRGDWENIWKNM